VLDLSEEPTQSNIERYLIASRVLDIERPHDPRRKRRSRRDERSSK
jgi:hypothetical protein